MGKSCTSCGVGGNGGAGPDDGGGDGGFDLNEKITGME